jgi:hypothetical protein
MDVSMREAMCEWLQVSASGYEPERWVVSYNNVRMNYKITPKCPWIPSPDEKVGLFMSPPV